MSDPIVIAGLGFVTPLGSNREAVWQAWLDGDSGVRLPDESDPRAARGVDPSKLPPVERAGLVRGFIPKEQVRSSQLRRMDWLSRMVVAAVNQAVADSGIPLENDSERADTAIVVGACFGNQRETQAYMDRVIKKGPGAGQPFLFPNLVLNAAAGYAAIELGIHGPNLTVSEHEASGELGIATAVDLLRAGLCRRAIVAGADEFGALYLDALRERGMLDAGQIEGNGRPSRQRARIVPGEGAASLVLEYESDARARECAPYAGITAASGAVPADPYAFGDPERTADRAFELLRTAGADEKRVDVLIGGADGTVPRDALDAALLKLAARTHGETPAYVPIDSAVGSWPSRGVFAAGLAALAVRRARVPGTNVLDPARILVVGGGRSGVVVPVAVDRRPRSEEMPTRSES